MKKFISMVMAAAMVVSLVPATAFAANTASFVVAGSDNLSKEEAKGYKTNNLDALGAEVQIKIGDISGTMADTREDWKIELEYDGIEAVGDEDVDYYGEEDAWTLWPAAGVFRGTTGAQADVNSKQVGDVYFKGFAGEATSVELKIVEAGVNILPGDVIVLPIDGAWRLSDNDEGSVATVTVSGAFGDSEAMTVVSVEGQGLDVTVAGKPVETAAEVDCPLKTIKIEPTVGGFDTTKDEIKVKVSKGWEITSITNEMITGGTIKTNSVEDDEFIIVVSAADEVKVAGMVVEAVSADAGEVCEVSVSCKGYEGDKDEAAIVIADAVVMSVDEDEDVPVLYSGVNSLNWGIQNTDSHKALEVTIEETVADSWDTVDKWTLTLPEGVFVVDDEETTLVSKNVAWKNQATMEEVFAEAYNDGDYEAFEFGRRALKAADEKEVMELTLNFVLVAEPEFEGDVVLTLEGDGVGEAQEVVIATFVKPYTVAAAQNDLVIDYKETKVPTEVTITEAEMGLWDDNTTTAKRADFAFFMEDIEVEDGVVTVDEDSDMTIKDKTSFNKANLGFYVDEESDEQAAVVTLSDIELYMQRNIPAGAYDLDMTSTMFRFMLETPYGAANNINVEVYDEARDALYYETVKEGFVNVITAGRDQDDASFTKKVVVPVGAMEIVAGEDVVALDVPAYINAAGYTMLPVRAVAVALGINTNNVIWDQATKTVTILYGQRIITMTVGQKVINVNGSAIPASAAVEVVNGRTFLGLRDLATALGVVDITWDAATQTATLNGGNK